MSANDPERTINKIHIVTFSAARVLTPVEHLNARPLGKQLARDPTVPCVVIFTFCGIERVFGHLKINRDIATRYDQLADSFLGILCLASARYWIKFVHVA